MSSEFTISNYFNAHTDLFSKLDYDSIKKCMFIIESFISWRPITENPIIDITFYEVLSEKANENNNLRLDLSKSTDKERFEGLMDNNIDNYKNCTESLFPILNTLSNMDNKDKATNLNFNITGISNYDNSPEKDQYTCESNAFVTENYFSN